MLRVLLWTLLVAGASVSGRSALPQDTPTSNWWSNKLFYQIAVERFSDSDGDTIGDLQGIIDNVDHLTDTGVEAVCLGYIYNSTDLKIINTTFGDLTVFENLVEALNKSNIRLILDFYLSGTSEDHPWFQSWRNKEGNYTNYYVSRNEPLNWLTPSGEKMWKEDPTRNVSYINFNPGAHLDLTQEAVIQDLKEVMEAWLGRNVSGFRILDASYLVQTDFSDENAFSDTPKCTEYSCFDHSKTINNQENYDILKKLKQDLNDSYPNRVLIVEPYIQLIDNVINGTNYLKNGADLVVNQALINLTMATPTTDLMNYINSWRDENSDSESTWMLSNKFVDRVGKRVGVDQLDSAHMIGLLLPGSHFGYFGDEIGMTGAVDLPFQWNSSRNTGFTNSEKAIKVDPSYWEVNLKDEKKADQSHFKNYKRLTELRKTLSDAGNFSIYNFNNLTFAFSRTKNDDLYMVLVNMDNMEETYSIPYNGTKTLKVHTASVNSGFSIGNAVNISSLVMRPSSGVVLTDGSISGAGYLKVSIALLAFCLAWIHL